MPEFTFTKLIGAVLAVIAFIILAVILLGMKVGGEFWYLGCSGEIGGNKDGGYDNPRCNIFNQDQCMLAYPNITREDQEFQVCIWDGSKCVLNSQLTCEDFSQTTTPKCQDVPDCVPVNAIKLAIERFAPKK